MRRSKAELESARDAARERRDAATDPRARDYATGYHAALEKVFDQHFRFPVAPGTVIHGIDVSKLDWTTRAMVMSRNLATIYALGGKPDPK